MPLSPASFAPLFLNPHLFVVSEALSLCVSLYLSPQTIHLTHTSLNNHQEPISVKEHSAGVHCKSARICERTLDTLWVISQIVDKSR